MRGRGRGGHDRKRRLGGLAEGCCLGLTARERSRSRGSLQRLRLLPAGLLMRRPPVQAEPCVRHMVAVGYTSQSMLRHALGRTQSAAQQGIAGGGSGVVEVGWQVGSGLRGGCAASAGGPRRRRRRLSCPAVRCRRARRQAQPTLSSSRSKASNSAFQPECSSCCFTRSPTLMCWKPNSCATSSLVVVLPVPGVPQISTLGRVLVGAAIVVPAALVYQGCKVTDRS
jgi:hypothetical protein